MNWILLVASIPATLVALMVREDLSVLAWVCLSDLLLFALVLLFYALRRGGINVLDPALWAIVGYLAFGQLPVALWLMEGRIGDIDQEEIEYAALLIIIAFRFLLLGLFAGSAIPVPRSRSPELPRIGLALPWTLILAGLYARLVSNNVFEGFGEYSWYIPVLLTATAVGVCLLFLAIGDRVIRELSLGVRFQVFAILAIALLCALVDVSRTNTGVILVTVLVLGVMGVRFGRLEYDVRVRGLAKGAFVLVAIWFVLLGTRAFSWAIANETDFWSEYATSFTERRANEEVRILAFVISVTPSTYEYFYGRTLGAVMPIPRSIWPERPAAHSYYIGLQWKGISDIAYAEEYLGDAQLSLSPHMVGEGYANFGIAGAMGIELAFGILVAAYARLLRAGRLRAMRIAFPLLLFAIITQQRGDVAMMNTGWIVSVLLLMACLWFSRPRLKTD